MTQVQVQLPTDSSRLVRILAQMGSAKTAVSRGDFAERLGRLYDLPDSIRLAAVHDRALSTTCEPGGLSREEVKAEFLRARATIVQSALRSFLPTGASLRLRFPAVGADLTPAQAMTPEPYIAFYAAQQRDIDFRVRNLHAVTRDAVAAFSPALARLAALDAALGDPLSSHNRRFFSTVGAVLRRRIDSLLEQCSQPLATDQPEDEHWTATLGQLRAEMLELLLAEIETRLLPTLGLIEALDEHEDD